ncbi:serine threonine- kinase N2 [Pelobates cultripes]|uniref:non-specific serine/threonine protein kinase n=1 Tax=Pelobates cultripes TaxID=61616 RepID=A0AAD1S1D2_PELCU|nr:serine threonine- kinase N2 [Pelobates cultripes]
MAKGNIFSCFRCMRPKKSTKRKTSDIAEQKGEELPECSHTPDSSKTDNGSSSGDGFSLTDLNIPIADDWSIKDTFNRSAQLDNVKIKEQIIEDIVKEKKMIEGAIKIRNATLDKKQLANLDTFIQTSQIKLYELYNKLQERNALTMQEAKEISNAPKADSSQADNEKLTNLQKQLEIELKVKHGAENMIREYSKNLSKNIAHIVAVQETLQENEKKIDSLRILILQETSIVREETLLAALETVNNIVAVSLETAPDILAQVLLAEYKDTKNMYALKVLKINKIVSSNKIHRLMCEKLVFQTVSNRRHPFLVNLFGCFHNEHHACFAMEFAAGGDLVNNLYNNGGPFSKPRAM